MKGNPRVIETPPAPDFEGLIDADILDRFKNSSAFYGDIINAQLIKTNRILIEEIKKLMQEADYDIPI